MENKILVVDDVAENRELLALLLEKTEDYKVIEANNGSEAVNLATKELPDIILMDWKMPGMDGVEATRILKSREKTKNIPILIVTAFSSTENLCDAFDAGANDYINKPIDKLELLSRVRAFLEYHRSIVELEKKKERIAKQNEELKQLSLIIRNSQNAFIVINENFEFEWVSESFTAFYDCTLEEYIDKYGNKLSNESYFSGIEKRLKNAAESNSPFTVIRECKTFKGAKKWVQVTITPVFTLKSKKLKQYIVVETDITKLKKAEERLFAQNEEMKQLTEHLGKVNEELEAQKNELKEQSLLLELEKDKSDAFLNSLFPKEVAWQLRSKGKAKPRHYKQVTVMFTDFKRFSKLCENLSPQEIVNILDYYIGCYDEIIEKHYIEKIKTIGDAYMCVGGLPLRNHSHPFDVVLAGLQIQKFMNNLNLKKIVDGLDVWELRVGIHTGDVVAGVVGKKKFAYDIWGANVNIASRMEQNSAVGEVNVSESTYQLIKEYFDCTYRGKIEAKNIGKVKMYFVQGLKTEYAADKERSEPNEKFQSILNQL